MVWEFRDTPDKYADWLGSAQRLPNLMAVSTSTLKRFTDLNNRRYFFRVTSVSPEGAESPFSNEESVDVENELTTRRNLKTAEILSNNPVVTRLKPEPVHLW